MKKINNLLIIVLSILMATNISGQTYVKFQINKDATKGKIISNDVVAIDVFAFGDYDGSGVINSANIIIDQKALEKGNYEIYKWESCVAGTGNEITYSPKPLQNPILNYACMEGVKDGDRIGTLWLSKVNPRLKGATDDVELKVHYNDLFFFTKIDGKKLSYEPNEYKIFEKRDIAIALYPNPFTTELHLMLKSEGLNNIDTKGAIEVLLFDASGKAYYKFNNIVPEPNIYQRLLVPNIPAGTYYLSVMQNDEVLIKSEPFVKVNQ